MLVSNCTWTWTSINGKNGYKVSSKKDSSKYIFLPAAGSPGNGSPGNGSLSGDGSYGGYWSSSLCESRPYDAWGLNFLSGYVDPGYYNYRYYGFSVRPVRRQ
ncbi:MAG: DUF1566 domain-containing protein [Bacteroidaceae bacterium]|nr:DUF1566 domain-containing protein [Bacteroidaceae bacterium]